MSQAVSNEDDGPRPVQFRPERPLPILRESIRERPAPLPPKPLPVIRQEAIARPQPAPIQRQIARPQIQDYEEENIPVRRPQPVRNILP